MGCLPSEIEGSETIVRVVKSPFHLNKTKRALTPRAFHPPRQGSGRELSVIRQLMGDDFCKNKGRDMLSGNPPARYIGLASGLVEVVRSFGAGVEDVPEDFEGHAHVVSMIAHPPADEPHPPATMLALDDYYRNMLEHFDYQADPSPEEDGWKGRALARKSELDVEGAEPHAEVGPASVEVSPQSPDDTPS